MYMCASSIDCTGLEITMKSTCTLYVPVQLIELTSAYLTPRGIRPL